MRLMRSLTTPASCGMGASSGVKSVLSWGRLTSWYSSPYLYSHSCSVHYTPLYYCPIPLANHCLRATIRKLHFPAALLLSHSLALVPSPRLGQHCRLQRLMIPEGPLSTSRGRSFSKYFQHRPILLFSSRSRHKRNGSRCGRQWLTWLATLVSSTPPYWHFRQSSYPDATGQGL